MKVIALIRLQWKTMSRQLSVMLIFLVLPVVYALFILFALQPLFASESYVDPFDVAVVDLDQSLETRMIILQLASSDDFLGVVQFLKVDMDQGRAMVKDDEVAALVVIPQRFVANMRAGRNTPIEVVGNPQRPLQCRLFLTMMRSGADLISAAQSGVNTIYHFLRDEISSSILNSEVNQAVIDFSLQSLGRRQIFADTILTETGSFHLEEYYVAAASVVLALLMGLYLLTVVRQDFSPGVEKRLLAHGLATATKITAKFFVIFSFLCSQLIIILALYLLVVQGRVTGNWLSLMIVLLGMAASASMLFTFLSSLSLHPYLELSIGTGLVSVLTVLGGNILPLSFLPQWMGVWSIITPTFWMREGFLHSAFIFDQEVVTTSVGVMVLSTIAFFAASYLAETIKLRGRRG